MTILKPILFVLIPSLTFTFGAFTHEKDLARNCSNYGDAKAWFYEIKCEVKGK